MRAGEFFWFKSKRYKILVSSRTDSELQQHAYLKAAKILANQKETTTHVILSLLTHGLWTIVLAISLREIDVAKWKLDIIQAEQARKRQEQRPEDQPSLEDRANALASGLNKDDIEILARAVQIMQKRDNPKEAPLRDNENAVPVPQTEDDSPPAYVEALEHR